jgi:hypothetical protein
MEHRHLACVATGRLAWFRILIGRQDARRPHSQDGCAPQDSDAGQHEQLPKRQAEQQEGKNHENDANGLETKPLPDGRNQLVILRSENDVIMQAQVRRWHNGIRYDAPAGAWLLLFT